MDAEEKKLQIKLAQIQTNIQINTAMGIGFLTLVFTSVIAQWQILTQPIEPNWLKGLTIVIFFGLMILGIILAIKTIQKVDYNYNLLNNLNDEI